MIIGHSGFSASWLEKYARIFGKIPSVTFTSDETAAITHLVCPRKDQTRTIKVLFALARKSYLVTEDWLEELIENGGKKRSEDEPFEITAFPKKIERLTIDNLLQGKNFIIPKDLFEASSNLKSDYIK